MHILIHGTDLSAIVDVNTYVLIIHIEQCVGVYCLLYCEPVFDEVLPRINIPCMYFCT